MSYGALGTTHHSLHDLAALLAVNNIDIVVPADNFETRAAVMAAVAAPRPLYLRLGKKAMPDLPNAEAPFDVGRARVLRQGADVTFIATGETVAPAWLAAGLLAQEGVDAGVISMHTLRPLDEQAILAVARTSSALVTVEEHSVHGGLGSLVASLLMQSGPFRPMPRCRHTRRIHDDGQPGGNLQPLRHLARGLGPHGAQPAAHRAPTISKYRRSICTSCTACTA